MTDVPLSAHHRRLVVVCVMLSMFMVAVEATIVATAMPLIVADVGGFSLFSWVFSVFLMAQVATAVIYGKLADLFGRRPTLIAGIAIFLVGSLLAGFAWSMVSLIVFRAVQGVGAGAIPPLINTIVGDHYAPQDRARMQGYIGLVWGASSIFGPLIGGFVVEHVSWSWIFWLNLPPGIVTILGLHFFLHEQVAPKRHDIDYLGAALFTIAVVAVLLLLTPERSGPFAGLAGKLALAVIALVCTVAFLRQERRAPEPMISFSLWRDPLIARANASFLFVGALVIGMSMSLPIYVQAVLTYSPTVAGLTVATVSLGWTFASWIAEPIYRVIGRRGATRLGGVAMLLGGGLFLLLGPDSSLVLPAIVCVVIGFGIGLVFLTLLVLVQMQVEWNQRGSATASTVFARALGSTFGVAILGAVFNYGLGLGGIAPSAGDDPVRRLIGRLGSAEELALLREALGFALHLGFWTMALFCLLGFALVMRVPVKELPKQPAV